MSAFNFLPVPPSFHFRFHYIVHFTYEYIIYLTLEISWY